MFETIKRYKALLILVVFVWITLITSYLLYVRQSYVSIQEDELKKHLVLSNLMIYKKIGEDYFNRATHIDAIDSDEYAHLQTEVSYILKLIGVDMFTAILPLSDDYFITMAGFSEDYNGSKTVRYFDSFLKVYKPTKNLMENYLKFLRSDKQQKFCFDDSVNKGFYAFVEKKYLSDKRMILICSSYERSKFNRFLEKTKGTEIKQTLLLLISMLPIFMYVVFIFFVERRQIKYRSLHNRLTGLKNINAFMKNKFKQAALLYIDLEFFAEYNRLYGHEVGNKLITEFSLMLQNYINNHNYKYYAFNGNDFGIFIDGLDEVRLEDEVKKVSEYLNRLEVKVTDDLRVVLRIKVGAATAKDPETLFENANSACSIAKRKGLHYYIYNEEIDRKNYLNMLETLIHAIRSNNIKVFYQPIVDINEKLVKYEALIRVYDKGKYLAPLEFLHISKMSGHYYDLTMIVLKQVLADVQMHKIHASFNLSYDDISNKTHADAILSLLAQSQYPHHITVELLESSAIEKFERLKEFINKVRELGVKIAIDDYGAEYSSMENILRIKPDFLKIDGSIVKNIVHDDSALTVLSTTTLMAKSLDMIVVAEYVASKEIFETAKRAGVDMFQGYYHSEPKPLSAFL